MVSNIFWRSIRNHVTFPNYPRPSAYGECSVERKLPISRRVPLAPSVNLSITSSGDIRAEFLSFFKERGHILVAPSTVYPRQQEGAYFINAGMNQFKPLFIEDRKVNQIHSSEFLSLTRAANSQPCIRIGGRHDDLNDVGYDTSHHTMFEMLGNWSFGSYGKEVACRQMWQFLTGVLGLPPSCLYVTYFGGSDELGLAPDDDTRDIWLSLGVSDQKLLPFGEKTNFWTADQPSGGGLCGPSTEIHVDFAALSGRRDLNCARCLVNGGDPRLVELWNCVFITHRLDAGNDLRSVLPLSRLFVDTGMGLERLASVMQGTVTTYDTDIFMPLLNFIHSEALRITGSTVPSYSNQYLLPGEIKESSGQKEAKVVSPDTKQFVPSKLSNLLKTLSHSHQEAEKRFEKNSSVGADLTAIDYENYRRDVAYRIVADHSRALSLAMQDGLLPGRQGVALKLRHLIYRATRAAVLTGLDSATNPSLLRRVVTQIPPTAPFSPDIQGPLARPLTPVLSSEQIGDIIDQEAKRFIPRLEKLEDAFNACLHDDETSDSLSDNQVEGLQEGRYGESVSWDMICAQARWHGLKTPSEPPQPKTKKRPSQPPTPSPNDKSYHLRTLLKCLPVTQDHKRYYTERIPSKSPPSLDSNASYSYEVPPLVAELLAIVYGHSDTPQLAKNPEDFDKILSSQPSEGERLGLVFDRSNFFSPCGGQATDIGVIKGLTNQKTLFNVLSAEKIYEDDSSVSSVGWTIHWVEPHNFDDTIIRTDSLLLCPDSERRFKLMRNHTGQHLLNWAFQHELASTRADSISGETGRSIQQSTVHYGGRVDPDCFSLRLTLLETPQQLETLVENVESRCRAVIEAKLPIVSQEVELERVVEKSFVKRFAWENYPNVVRVVCVGGDLETLEEKISALPEFCSAELCGGTHLRQTEDLVDVVIIGIRSRNLSVKELLAISGESASKSRNNGERVISQISANLAVIERTIREAENSVGQLLDCAENITALILQVDSVLGGCKGNLSYLHRSTLMRYQRRLPALLGEIKNAMRKCVPIPSSLDPLMFTQLERLLKVHQADTSASLLVEAFDISNYNKLALSILHMSPKYPFVLYQKGLALFYHPEVKGKALEWATVITKRLDLRDWNLGTRVECFRGINLGTGADHFAIVRLFSLRDQGQRDWKPHVDRLIHSLAES